MLYYDARQSELFRVENLISLLLSLLNRVSCKIKCWLEKLVEVLGIEEVKDFVHIVQQVLLW